MTYGFQGRAAVRASVGNSFLGEAGEIMQAAHFAAEADDLLVQVHLLADHAGRIRRRIGYHRLTGAGSVWASMAGS